MNDDGSLADTPLMFVFLDIASLPRHRRLYEDVIGLRVIENQFHPPHEHHGLVKYDAGGTILSINLFAERKFRGDTSDGVVLVCRTTVDNLPDRLDAYGVATDSGFTDVDGHHYVFQHTEPADRTLTTDIVELRLAVDDVATSVPFYRDVLGLRPVSGSADTCRFATGSLDLVLDQRRSAVDGRPIRHNACLMVFYTSDVEAAERALVRRGLAFRTGAAFSDIGGTARFNDPSGHIFCLYQPSAESLTWGSADKVLDLMTGGARASR
jgi:catechol 2,3-dioxygenase-like lactoylglutathione lyase family enzyme